MVSSLITFPIQERSYTLITLYSSGGNSIKTTVETQSKMLKHKEDLTIVEAIYNDILSIFFHTPTIVNLAVHYL